MESNKKHAKDFRNISNILTSSAKDFEETQELENIIPKYKETETTKIILLTCRWVVKF